MLCLKLWHCVKLQLLHVISLKWHGRSTELSIDIYRYLSYLMSLTLLCVKSLDPSRDLLRHVNSKRFCSLLHAPGAYSAHLQTQPTVGITATA